MPISPNLHLQVILQVDLRWPLTLICDLLTAWTYEGSHIISINQIWFKSDFNFSSEATFTFSAYLTTWTSDDLWPWYMSFDLDMWPLTALTCEVSKFGSNWTLSFQMRPLSHFQPILQLDLRWPLTLICGLWPHQQMTIPMLHLWPNFGWNSSKHVEGRAKC